jgi:hypothetical protein
MVILVHKVIKIPIEVCLYMIFMSLQQKEL